MRPTGLLLTFLLLALGATAVESAPRKCVIPWVQMPGMPDRPVFLLDGSYLTEEESSAIDRSILAQVQVMCWKPETGEISRGGVGVPVIFVLTVHLVESTRGPMEGLLQAQEAHFSQHSRYAHSLEDLADFGVPEDTMLELSVTSAGWSAATPGGDVAYRCFATHRRDLWCQPGAKGSRTMREMYEGVGR